MSIGQSGVFCGLMHDLFVLNGRRPVRLANGFTAVFTTYPNGSVTYDPISQFGDPIDFAAGTSRCDPL